METTSSSINTSWLQTSGIVGIILSFLYFFGMIKACGAVGNNCSPEMESVHLHIVSAQTLYFLLTSTLFTISAYKIKLQKKSGGYFFTAGLFLIGISLLLPSNLFFQNSLNLPWGFRKHSLFELAINNAILGSIDLLGLSLIGTILFYWGILKTAFTFYKL